MASATATGNARDEWMSAQAAADVLGDSRVKVLNAVIGGSLVGKRIAGRVIVRRDSVDAEIERRKQLAAHEEVAAAK